MEQREPLSFRVPALAGSGAGPESLVSLGLRFAATVFKSTLSVPGFSLVSYDGCRLGLGTGSLSDECRLAVT